MSPGALHECEDFFLLRVKSEHAVVIAKTSYNLNKRKQNPHQINHRDWISSIATLIIIPIVASPTITDKDDDEAHLQQQTIKIRSKKKAFF